MLQNNEPSYHVKALTLQKIPPFFAATLKYLSSGDLPMAMATVRQSPVSTSTITAVLNTFHTHRRYVDAIEGVFAVVALLSGPRP
jgi:hypothetical protein